MEIFQFWPVYIVLLTVLIPTGAQTSVLNVLTDTTRISEKDIPDNRRANSQQNEQVNSQGNRNRVEEKPLNILSDSKENNPALKSAQLPADFVIDTKLQAIPIRNQLILKSGNVKPGPAHYLRLKGNMDGKNNKPKSQAAFSSNEQTSRKSIAVKDKVKSKSDQKSSHKNKSNNLEFFEDKKDSDTPLLKELKSVKPTKHRKTKHKHHYSKTQKPENEIYDEVKHETRKHDTDRDCIKTTNIRNATQSITISKLPQSILYDMKPKEANESLGENLQKHVPLEKPTTLPNSELEFIPTLVSENTTIAVFAIDCNTQNADKLSDSKYIQHTEKAAPITAVDPESELPEIITIKDHNYQEIEERRLPSYPEQITVEEYTSGPWATETLNPVSINPYDSYIQNYQTAYSSNLAENDSPTYNQDNFYVRPKDLDPINTYIPEVPQIFSPCAQEDVQEMYEPKLGYQSNTINVWPENFVRRIWRTWKDTEIKLNKPKYANNRPFQLQMNPNVVNYKENTAKTPLMQGFQPMSTNSYCNNLNYMWPYPYFSPFNGYLG